MHALAAEEARGRWWSVAGARLIAEVRSAGLPEAAVAVVLASTLWLPAAIGGKAWPPALLLLFVAAAVRALRDRRLGPVPTILAAYLAVYAAAAVHGGALGASDAARYFLRPLAGLAVATLVVTAAERRRVLWLVVLFTAVEIPITAGQAIENVVRYGREASRGADSVTGLLGPSQAGVVTLVSLAAAALVVGEWLAGLLRPIAAAIATAALVAVGIFAATRATLAFVVVMGIGIVAFLVMTGRARPSIRRLAVVLAAAAAAVPLIYGATRAIYPDAYAGALSSQNVLVLGGARAEGVPPPTARPRSGNGKQSPPTPAPAGVQLLPGRVAQIRTALRISVDDGVAVALVGRGLGTSELDPRYHLAQDVPDPQRTGTTWIGRVLTETGWLGLCAFAVLLIWVALLGRKIWRNAASGSDRAIGAALPGIAALTALGSAYTTILDVRGYSAVFWILVGIGMSAGLEPRWSQSTQRGRAVKSARSANAP